MESNNNNPNNKYPTFQDTFKPAQVDQSDPLGVYTGNPAPNSSQIFEKPTFQNPNPQPQMNNYPNYYQNQPPQGQPTPNQQYMNQNQNMNANYNLGPNGGYSTTGCSQYMMSDQPGSYPSPGSLNESVNGF